MTPMNVKIIAKNDDKPFWPELKLDPNFMFDVGALQYIAILEGGTAGGNPSVMFCIPTYDKHYVIAQQTAKQMVMLARIIEAKFPGLMED